MRCHIGPEQVLQQPLVYDPRVANPFYKGKNGGLGLGLAIVHELVAAHGDKISFKSSAGSGTTFRVMLPSESAR